MEMKIPMIAITVTVCVIVLAGVLMPVLTDATDDQKTIFNNNYGRYSQLLESDVDDFRMTVVWEGVTTTNVTVSIGDDEPYVYSTSSSRAPLIVTEGGMVRADKVNSRGYIYYEGSANYVNINTSPITIEVNNGMVTTTFGTDPANTYTWNVGRWLFYPDNNGNYTAMSTSTDADTRIYLNSIEDLYYATIINTNSLGFVSGHGSECTFFSQSGTPTYSMTLESEKVDGYKDVISTSIGSYAVSTDAGTNSDGSPFVPFITMVPRSIDGHTPSNASANSLLMTIPILIIVALLVTIVAVSFRRDQF